MRSLRRRRFVAGVSGAGAWILAACGPQRAGPAGRERLSEAPVTIQFFKRGTRPENEVEAMLRDWHQAHPTWKVAVTQGIDQTKLNALAAAGEKIDVLGWFQAARTLILSLNNVRSIDEQVKRDRYPVHKFSAKEIDLIGRYEGKLYALPYAYGGNATAIFYNRNLFREAGVPEPPDDWNKAWTWEQFREVLRKLTKKSGATTTQIGLTDFGDPITSLLVLTDGKWISDDYRKAMADAPETIQTFERWADIVLKDGTVRASQGVDLGSGDPFINGRAAMHVICCGPADYATRLEGTGIDWAFAPQPKIKYASPDFQSNIILLLKSGEQPEHGWELMKYLIEANRYGNLEKRIPAVLDDAPQWARETFKDKPAVRAHVVAEGVKFARPVDKIKYHPATQEMYDLVQPALRDIWAGKAPVAQTLRSLQPQLQAIIDRSR
jgi:multiple sugar transport system substrate-binding protein